MDTALNDIAKHRKAGFIALFFIVLTVAAAVSANEIYRPHAAYQGTKTIEIAPGLGSRKIGAFLKEKGVIRSKWAFVTYVSLRNEASSLKPGVYTFGHAAIPEIANTLIHNKKTGIMLTVPEGWSKEDIAEYLRKTSAAQSGDFLPFLKDAKASGYYDRFSFLAGAPADAGLEGFLFPDTYQIYPTASASEIVEKMLENFERKFDTGLRNEIIRRKKTVFEIVTMASLIEKEAAEENDRRIISGILWKRLEHGLPLQVDASIIYVKNLISEMPESKNAKVSLADTKIDSPYNTYLYRGLPKGPIANPGISAIRAAATPTESPYLYYLSTPEGKIIYSKTFADHNRAKAKYLK